jgi:PAS domain S-box-containing protein
VLLDLVLPGGKSGIDVIRALDPRARHLKVIMMTAHRDVGPAVEALRLGAFDYVLKPFDFPELLVKVARAAEERALDLQQEAVLSDHAALLDTIPGIVWFVTDQGVVRRINDEGAELLGYRPAQLLGQPYQVLLGGREPDDVTRWAFCERRSGDRATRRAVVALETAHGGQRLFEIYSSGIYADAELGGKTLRRFCGTVGVAHDITEQTRLQEELQTALRLEALGKLAGGVAHDFNNLLTVIVTNTELAEEIAGHQGRLAEHLAEIHEAARRGAGLTRQLLTFSRQSVADAKVVDLAQVVGDTMHLLGRLLSENIEVRLQIDAPVDPVLADVVQMQQIVLNLVANARDAMPNGGTLTVRVCNVRIDAIYAKSKPGLTVGDYVMLAVGDTGVGMTAEQQRHLFEPFFTTKEASKGTGLGLATVYGALRAAGGYVSVYSEPSLGTTMKLLFPRCGPQAAQPTAVTDAATPARGEGLVLLVEDDAIVRRTTQRVLAQAGYRVISAGDGQEALALLASVGGIVDVVVTDVVMPRLDGAELGRQIRARTPETPIVYMSGHVGDIVGRFNLTQERTTFLQKPFSADTLLAAVARVRDPGS